MQVIRIPIGAISASNWNANEMDSDMKARLRRSIEHFGLVVPLVVRAMGDRRYETVGGAHRLEVLREMGVESAACVVVDVDDADARLLSQCLNRLQGEDNLGLRAELIRRVLEDKPMSVIISLLPDSVENLEALSKLGEADLAGSLRRWQAEQMARLRHMTFQLVPSQIEVVEEAIERFRVGVTPDGASPSRRGTALYRLCLDYLSRGKPQ